MKKFDNREVENVFNKYPPDIREKILFLRKLVMEVAAETEDVTSLKECLKWGEPSYLTKGGSTIRMDWKKPTPDQYAIYFNCKTSLVDTFKERYKDIFIYESNRAIIFHKNDTIPIYELKHCIMLSLTYHNRKHLPLLGI